MSPSAGELVEAGQARYLRNCPVGAIKTSVPNRAAHLLLFALVLVVVEGAIRKWCIGAPSSRWSFLAYFSKDIVFASIVLCRPKVALSPALSFFKSWLFA